MVEPVGYEMIWQKFENEVYEKVKEVLGDTFKVEWSYEIRGLKPDVAALLECSGCRNRKEESPCIVPAFIFDAYCKFKVEKEYYAQKDKQMKKYSEICDSILVMPQGYEQRPYCRSGGGEYHIVSFQSLASLLKSIDQEVIIGKEEDICGFRPICDSKNVYRHFELSFEAK